MLFSITACQFSKPDSMNDTKAPVARIIPQQLTMHGHTRTDNYFWLKERENPEVLAYLQAENAYTDAMTAQTKEMQDALFTEMKSRIREKDESVPYKYDDYYYYVRYEEGREYPLHCRKKGSMDAAEELIIDENERAEGHDFYSLGEYEVSPDHRILGYTEDTVSRRLYVLRFKDLSTGKEFPETITNVAGDLAWANDNKTVFYTRKDVNTLQENKVYRHVLGTDPRTDVLVFEEKDDAFSLGVESTKSQRYVFIESSSTLATEIRFIDADHPEGTFTVFLPREKDHEYEVIHDRDKFYIITNWKAQNFRLMETPVSNTAHKEQWKEVIPHREDVLLEGMDVFRDHLVIEERKEGLLHLRVMDKQHHTEHYIDFGEPAYTAWLDEVPEYNTDVMRFRYTSLTTPVSTYDYNMRSQQKTLLKQQAVLGTFDKNNYVTERVYVPAADGAKIPVSIVYRKDFKKDGTHPLYQYAYGSYGSSTDVYFSSTRLSLLDRGFAFAICHIRGGQEMGRHWYEDGKLLKKKNTFTDFIACSDYLVSHHYTGTDRLVASGGSAGGLLMGAVANMRPDLYGVIVADVPFVDVVTTMLDESIPLTTYEYDEWGNPNDRKYYDYMLSYSPYDNVKAQAYPNMLVTTGLHDSQVQYWEPAKWVAKLRSMKTDNKLLLLKTNMEAGHGGASGRFEGLKEIAFEYAFLLDVLKVK